jgi:hypothetical protein
MAKLADILIKFDQDQLAEFRRTTENFVNAQKRFELYHEIARLRGIIESHGQVLIEDRPMLDMTNAEIVEVVESLRERIAKRWKM